MGCIAYYFLYSSSYIYGILYSCGTAVMYHDVQIDNTVTVWVYVHYLYLIWRHRSQSRSKCQLTNRCWAMAPHTSFVRVDLFLYSFFLCRLQGSVVTRSLDNLCKYSYKNHMQLSYFFLHSCYCYYKWIISPNIASKSVWILKSKER